MTYAWYQPVRIPEGEQAPDFRLDSTDGEFHLYTDLKEGPRLFMSYMGNFGTGCTYALKQLADATPDLEALGARVAAMSVNSIHLHQRFLARMDFPFPLISDPGGKVAGLYGFRITKHMLYEGMAGRAVYLIDSDGKVLYSWIHPDPAGIPNFAELIESVRALL